jgi:hypothetical protein
MRRFWTVGRLSGSNPPHSLGVTLAAIPLFPYRSRDSGQRNDDLWCSSSSRIHRQIPQATQGPPQQGGRMSKRQRHVFPNREILI